MFFALRNGYFKMIAMKRAPRQQRMIMDFLFFSSLGLRFAFFAKNMIGRITRSSRNAGMPLLLRRLKPTPDKLKRM